ncbi:lipoprotein insertase outer membrane protein LolB [Halomonas cerina]|uniref:Outer-membrane lipoprotein LolB n=1 Tax=Halomonas cerina TaxID=447424 RepID=A0A839VB84_9GAMM|nr:lipoprotein insertase outer membrane protein LolB [Halomonas cerina]MBB3189756.1 outer membrane lipoprotein LolB [Halomonas cerina]
MTITLPLRLLLLLLTLFLLAGCAGRAPAPVGDRAAGQWEAQRERLSRLDHWELSGKVGLRTPEESTSATLDWRRTPYHFRLLISGPFGSGRSVLEGREGRVSLTTGEGRFEAESAEALMRQQLGWSLPVAALDDWMIGLPAANRPHRLARDALGFPHRLEQDGWQIEYRDWTRAESLWLPRRLVMTYGDLRVTLVATEWRPESTDV